MNSNCPALLRQIMELQFTAIELNLFLDTHPNSQDALRDFRQVIERLQPLMDEYQSKCTPLLASGAGMKEDCWDWIEEPWPWERNY